jgi:hypothetical protein
MSIDVLSALYQESIVSMYLGNPDHGVLLIVRRILFEDDVKLGYLTVAVLSIAWAGCFTQLVRLVFVQFLHFNHCGD